jgi:hypothetical protein
MYEARHNVSGDALLMKLYKEYALHYTSMRSQVLLAVAMKKKTQSRCLSTFWTNKLPPFS